MTDPDPVPQPADDATERLVRAGLEGDAARFGQLYERLAPAVFAWARLRIPVALRVQIEPDDVLQEAWIRAYGAFSTFDPERGRFRPWLFQVAKHALLDMIRRVSVREPPAGLGAGGHSVHFSQIRDEVTSLSRRLARRDDINAFLDEASRMNEEDRRLLVHCGLEGMTVTEAAPRVGLGREAAFKRWQRLRARLATGPLPAGLLEG